MKYLYNFYYSTAVKEMAQELGFATLPDIVRDIVVKKLIDVTQCNTGEYALAQYNAISSNIMSTHDFSPVLSSYLSVYRTVDSGARWDLMKSDDSRTILQHFSTEPEKFAGTLTMLNGKTQKLNYLNKEGLSTFAFAHLAVVFIYHLDYFTSCSNSQLRLNNYIIEGIFLGNITHWNDSKIQLANNNFKKCLPHLPITLVVRSNPSDTNSILIRYLTRISPEFSSIYDSQGGGTDFQYFNWSSILPKNRLKLVVGNSFSDNEVVAEDLTIGYYLHVTPPTSGVALYCPDETCTTVIHPNDDGHSIGICQNDINTIINPSSSLYSYDLMISKTVGCYPLVGTVDFSIYQAIPSSSCMMKNFSTILGLNKIRLGVFLFNGSTITKPLNILSSAPTSVEQRKSALSNICNLTCDGAAVGYKYCGYRDCSWSDGDYTQLVSACSPNTQRRKVTYVRTNTSCSENFMTVPPSAVLIECPYVLVHSHIAAGMITICVMGAIICGVILYLSYNYSHEKVLRRSQLIFVYIFLIGAIFMNFTLLCLLGENTKSSCMLRVWAVNLSSTLMFAPLIMKLHRVDVLYRTLQRGGRRRTISDFTVGMQVFGLVAVDVLILIIWTIVDTPREIVERKLYVNTYHTIDDTVCSTNITEPFEKAMVSWKAILLVFGIIKAIQTWEVPKEISEAKHFAIAIYNIAVVGSFSYFLSVFGTVSVEVVVVLRCLGIFVCATVSAIVIMMPKLLAIQFSWTEMLLGSASSYKDEFSYSSTSHQPIPIAQTQLHNVHQNQNQNHNQNDGLPTLRINPALNLDLNAVLTQRNELPREDTALASGAIVHRDGVNL